MGAGGMLSAAHTQEDVDFTVEAFRRTLGALKAEGLL
jgi:glutamate-1-semialdehyde aminotransferase